MTTVGCCYCMLLPARPSYVLYSSCALCMWYGPRLLPKEVRCALHGALTQTVGLHCSRGWRNERSILIFWMKAYAICMPIWLELHPRLNLQSIKYWCAHSSAHIMNWDVRRYENKRSVKLRFLSSSYLWVFLHKPSKAVALVQATVLYCVHAYSAWAILGQKTCTPFPICSSPGQPKAWKEFPSRPPSHVQWESRSGFCISEQPTMVPVCNSTGNCILYVEEHANFSSTLVDMRGVTYVSYTVQHNEPVAGQKCPWGHESKLSHRPPINFCYMMMRVWHGGKSTKPCMYNFAQRLKRTLQNNSRALAF